MKEFAIKYWNEELVFLQNDVLSKEKKGRSDLDKVSERIKAIEDDLPYYLSVNKLIFRETSARDFLDLPHDYSWYMNENPAFREHFVKRNLLHEIP